MARDSAAAAVTAAAAALQKSQDQQQQLEKYQPDEALVALSKRRSVGPQGVTQPTERLSVSVVNQKLPSTVTVTVRPLQQIRQNVIQQPATDAPSAPPTAPMTPAATTTQPAAAGLEAEDGSGHGDQNLKTTRAPDAGVKNGKIKLDGSSSSSKGSPKLTVRRQFEHLINLAAAQFQRSASPSKSGSRNNNAASNNQEAISMELKQLEDEIKNAAMVKAEASAKLEQLQNEHAAKSRNGSMKSAILVKPELLVATRVNGDCGPPSDAAVALKSLQKNPSSNSLQGFRRRSAMSPPPAPPGSEVNRNGPDANGSVAAAGNGVVRSTPLDEESVRYARVKRLEALDHSEASDDLPMPATPTDSYESSSVCSDLRDRESGDDESVSERIFRKSFYTRFNESSKKKQQQHRRSVTNKDLVNTKKINKRSFKNNLKFFKKSSNSGLD